MQLAENQARSRLAAHDHAILCTSHSDRGVDAIPVCFAVDGDHAAVPIDTVKPKASTRLQRERNLEFDPRATLLVEHWDADDWSRLWWVRAALRWDRHPGDRTDRLASLLAERYPRYHDQPFAGLLVFRIVGVSGWAASSG